MAAIKAPTTVKIKKASFTKKRTSKADRTKTEVKVFVSRFYQRYGEMMTLLSHE